MRDEVTILMINAYICLSAAVMGCYATSIMSTAETGSLLYYHMATMSVGGLVLFILCLFNVVYYAKDIVEKGMFESE